jgi:hypothetical protein
MRRVRASAQTTFLRLAIAVLLLAPLSGSEKAATAAQLKPKAGGNRSIIDYDGDGRSDISVFSWEDRTIRRKDLPDFFFTRRSEFPLPLLGDFNGDGKTEVAYFDRGYWRIFGHMLTSAGFKGDLPVPADYDGDGKTDPASWRPADGLWTFRSLPPWRWGNPDDIPVPMDYDGDGKADIAVWRPAEGSWYIHFASGYEEIVQCGGEGDIPVPADYDGDGKADIAVWRPAEGNWYIQNAGKELTVTTWGAAGDVPVPGDYDGDGRVDIAVWRPEEGQWYIKDQKNVIFGQPEDTPLTWNIWILWAKKLFDRTKENEDNSERKEAGIR